MTIFNRKESDEGDTWYPTILRNVQLNMDKAAILAKYGPNAADSAILNIRYVQDGNNKIIAGKRWLPPKEWEKSKEYSETITFTSGDRFDFFWLGDWGNEHPVRDAEYASYIDFYTFMNKTYDYVFAISSVGGPYSIIPHFEILGK
ncbi:MAG: hypothetical protein J6Q92_05225 [Oscillospiraceae bacterium]|nr:hypothetical protein [Oscillospiraceae bacterium]